MKAPEARIFESFVRTILPRLFLNLMRIAIDMIADRTYLPRRIRLGLPATLIIGYVDPQKRASTRANAISPKRASP